MAEDGVENLASQLVPCVALMQLCSLFLNQRKSSPFLKSISRTILFRFENTFVDRSHYTAI